MKQRRNGKTQRAGILFMRAPWEFLQTDSNAEER
jgi:hypothetical protein